ncbi:cytochrome P450 [Mycena rebaudengoi]|nr:cytochrome P450 [Mycena rebaudengoi]
MASVTQLLDLPLSPKILLGSLAAAFLTLKLLRTLFNASLKSKIDAIPSVGVPGGPFGFYIGSWNYIKDGRAITEEGHAKYPNKAFKVAMANRWLVIVCGRENIQRLQKAADDELSPSEAINALLHLTHTMGHESHYDQYQIPVIRTPLTRNIGICFPAIRSEVVAAFKDLVPAKADGLKTVLKVVSRTSNRYFIGMKCRDPEYIALTAQFSLDVVKDATLLHLTPAILRPLVMRLFGHLETATRSAVKYVGPTIQHRLEMHKKYGRDWPDAERPNDLLTWLIDAAGDRPDRLTVRSLTIKVLLVNFGAIHTTTQGFLHAFYNLAAHPEYTAQLREEIQSVVRSDGWTKAAMGKMTKLDSFFKETSRLSISSVSIMRLALKDFALVDGTAIPAGTLVGVPIGAEQNSETNYPNAHEFDPFRFSRMREEAGEGMKHHMVTPSPEFLAFGLGRHACPGRFFAANEMKLMLAHVIMTYDVKFRDGVRPADEWTAMVMQPNSKAEVMFRLRA